MCRHLIKIFIIKIAYLEHFAIVLEGFLDYHMHYLSHKHEMFNKWYIQQSSEIYWILKFGPKRFPKLFNTPHFSHDFQDCSDIN